MQDKRQFLAQKNIEIAERFGIKNPPRFDIVPFVGVLKKNANALALYDPATNMVYINKAHVDDGVKVVGSFAHEIRHCWQHERARNPVTEEDFKIEEGLKSYVEPTDDYDMYYNNPVERDARVAAMEYLRDLFKELLNGK